LNGKIEDKGFSFFNNACSVLENNIVTGAPLIGGNDEKNAILLLGGNVINSSAFSQICRWKKVMTLWEELEEEEEEEEEEEVREMDAVAGEKLAGLTDVKLGGELSEVRIFCCKCGCVNKSGFKPNCKSAFSVSASNCSCNFFTFLCNFFLFCLCSAPIAF